MAVITPTTTIGGDPAGTFHGTGAGVLHGPGAGVGVPRGVGIIPIILGMQVTGVPVGAGARHGAGAVHAIHIMPSITGVLTETAQ